MMIKSKKIFLFVLSMLLFMAVAMSAIFCFTIGAEAQDKTRLKTYAVKGSAVIDGEIDDAWNNAYSNKLQRLKNNFVERDTYVDADGNPLYPGTENFPTELIPNPEREVNPYASAEFRTMWDDDYVYVLVKVRDPKIIKGEGKFYNNDSIEVFFSFTTGGSDPNDANMEPTHDSIRIVYDASEIGGKRFDKNTKGYVPAYENGGFAAMEYAASAEGAKGNEFVGYAIELKIDLKDIAGGAAVGKEMAIDVTVNDNAGISEFASPRDYCLSWNDVYDKAGARTSCLGVLQFADNANELESKPIGDDCKREKKHGYAVESENKIVVDGEVDADWLNAQPQSLDRLKNSWDGINADHPSNVPQSQYPTVPTKATFFTLWKDTDLFVFAKIDDPFLSKRGKRNDPNKDASWFWDSVDIGIATEFYRGGNDMFTYKAATHETIRVVFDNSKIVKDKATGSLFKEVATKVNATRDGYTVELRVDVGGLKDLGVGAKMMIDFQVNDDAGNDEWPADNEERRIGRDFCMSWNDLDDKLGSLTNAMGVIEFAGKTIPTRKDITLDATSVIRKTYVNRAISFANIKSSDEEGFMLIPVIDVRLNTLIVPIQITGFTPNTAGIYNVTITSTDMYRRKKIEAFDINVFAPSTDKPTIDLSEFPLTINVGEKILFNKIKVSTNNVDEVVKREIVRVTGPDGDMDFTALGFTAKLAGSYEIEIKATDSFENFTRKEVIVEAKEVDGTLPVIDTSKISLKGTVNKKISLAAVSASDNSLETIKVELVSVKLGDTEIAASNNEFTPTLDGDYVVSFSATDSSGNIATAQITIKVEKEAAAPPVDDKKGCSAANALMTILGSFAILGIALSIVKKS